MTREYLKNLGLTDEQISSIIAENGKDIETAKGNLSTVQQQLTAAQTEASGLKDQLAQRDKDIADLKKQVGDNNDLNGKLTALQEKYNTDTKALQDKLNDQAYDHAADKYMDGYKFSSKAARKAALSDFRAKKPKLVDGKFEGADEIMAAMKKDDPSMFAPDDNTGKDGGDKDDSQNNNGAGKQPPRFTNGTLDGAGGGEGAPASPFDFGFTAVRNVKP